MVQGPRPAAAAGRLVLLVVLGAGVFLAGLELMVTAVALPAIVPDLSDWTQLRRASWIINGYLLAYVAVMPVAGRASDVLGTRRLLLAALALFTVGSALAGRAQDLDELIAARVVQGAGGGALVPLATAGASHLFDERGRPRALGLIGALTFLGMAVGPFVGAAVLDLARLEGPLTGAGLAGSPAMDWLTPAWRWVFYVNVPVGLVALAYSWAAMGTDTPRRPGRVDLPGALLFAAGLGCGLAAVTWAGSPEVPGGTGGLLALALASAALVALAVVRGALVVDGFIETRHFADRVYASAVLVSLLTGYGLATAIVGGAVFVDRVLYGGPETQRVALGALAAAVAAGAFLSGFLVRALAFRVSALAGLAFSALGLVRMGAWGPDVDLARIALDLALFGFGFGVTVTPRSTAAVEALGRRAYGAASAAVTVARMVGMTVGLAVLTQFGSNRIDALARIVGDPLLRDTILPPGLRGRPLNDGLVVEALERWAAGQAAEIMSLLFLIALAVTVAAIVPAWLLGAGRPRRATGDGAGEEADAAIALQARPGPRSRSDRCAARGWPARDRRS